MFKSKLTCKQISSELSIVVNCWPTIVVEKQRLLEHETFDDEGASVCFGGKTWKEVIITDILKHPTASNYISDYAFQVYTPSILCAYLWASKASTTLKLQTQWGVPIECLKEQAILVIDHFFQDLLERKQEGKLNYSDEQWIAVEQVKNTR